MPTVTIPETWHPAPGQLPAGRRLYAVGDVHGQTALLDALLAAISADRRHRPGPTGDPPPTRSDLVFLGDLVDRGPDSRGVVDRVATLATAADDRVACLRGNHEQMMLDFLADPWGGLGWLINGGLETLDSYGVASEAPPSPDGLVQLAQALAARLPSGHRAFLAGLPTLLRAGGYVLVHAGVRPGVALEDQDPEDLVWIRDPFLNSTQDFGAVVVHGHTIRPKVEVHPNRIGLDTGAFASGRLSCAVLEGAHLRILEAEA